MFPLRLPLRLAKMLQSDKRFQEYVKIIAEVDLLIGTLFGLREI